MVSHRSKTDLTSSGWIAGQTKAKKKKKQKGAECCQSHSIHKAKPTVQHREDK